MKVLGKKSLSSKVENGLKVLFGIITLLDIIVLATYIITLFLHHNTSLIMENYLLKIVLITIISVVFLSTGIVALFIIYEFIKIFKNLKENQIFEKNNIMYLNKVSILSIIMGILYLICLMGVSICLSKYLSFDLLSDILIRVLIFVFSVAFLIFGIGIRILNEIYKRAIEYKEVNDFTI